MSRVSFRVWWPMRLLLLPVALAFALAGSLASQSRVLSPWLETALRQGSDEERHRVWVYFRDKGPKTTAPAASASAVPLSARTRARRVSRATVTRAMLLEDLPLDPRYVEQVTTRVTRMRHHSRWLNAVSVEASASQIQAVATLPFVERLDVVRRYRRARVEPFDLQSGPSAAPSGSVVSRSRATLIDYGGSLDQIAQIGVPELHRRGLTGKGIVVAVFDAGFPNLAHDAFSQMMILAEHDFVHGLDTVRGGGDSHGTATLSVLGGFRDGELIGPAYGATFMLAVTEDSRSETPVEEDNWAAAAEWAESMGADVISSSLGYAQFDLPFSSYTDRDMNGETAISTRAASMAAARGVVVVSSVGNGGFHPLRNTLAAPADGKQVLSVGAVDRAGLRAAFSSAGPTADGRIKPDVAALGVMTKVARTASTSAYAFASGTSFSCPLVAGAIALLLQAHPTYTVDQVLFALRSTAGQSLAPDNLLGWGIVDAVGAVEAETVPIVEAVRGLSFTFAWRPSATWEWDGLVASRRSAGSARADQPALHLEKPR